MKDTKNNGKTHHQTNNLTEKYDSFTEMKKKLEGKAKYFMWKMLNCLKVNKEKKMFMST